MFLRAFETSKFYFLAFKFVQFQGTKLLDWLDTVFLYFMNFFIFDRRHIMFYIYLIFSKNKPSSFTILPNQQKGVFIVKVLGGACKGQKMINWMLLSSQSMTTA
jgi:hypothetical protein